MHNTHHSRLHIYRTSENKSKNKIKYTLRYQFLSVQIVISLQAINILVNSLAPHYMSLFSLLFQIVAMLDSRLLLFVYVIKTIKEIIKNCVINRPINCENSKFAVACNI